MAAQRLLRRPLCSVGWNGRFGGREALRRASVEPLRRGDRRVFEALPSGGMAGGRLRVAAGRGGKLREESDASAVGTLALR